MICIPTSQSRSLSIHRYSAAHAVRELEPLLNQKTYRQTAAALGERLHQEDGVKMACDALEKLLAS